MKKSLNQTLGRRILSLAMVLLMAFPWVTSPAMAASDWSSLQISVSWTDGSGNPQSATASMLGWTQDPSFWVQVNSDAPFQSVTLSFSLPGHDDYQYDAGLGFGNLTLTNVKNAGGLDTNSAVYINVVDGNSNPVTTSPILLFISTSVQPEEPAATERPPVQKEIDVIYKGTDDVDLGSVKFTATQGQDNPVTAPNTIDKDGKTYTLKGDAAQNVTINENGEASPSPVTFYYDPPTMLQKEIDVIYTGSDGADLGSVKFTATQGQDNPVTAPNTIDKDGKTYTLKGDAIQNVTVNEKGEASPNPVTFYYDPPTMHQKEIDVIYKGNDGADLGSVKFTATQGQDNPVTAPNTIDKDGKTYTLSGEAVQNVTVNEKGEASPDPVTFYYDPPAKQPAQKEVDVIYKGNDNADLGGVKFTATQGQDNPVTAPNTIDKDGKTYTLAGNAVQNITVNENGEASPNPVIFYYAPPAEAAKFNVQIDYVKDGQVFHTDYKGITAGKTEPVPEDVTQTPAGYTLDGPNSVDVTMDANGVATPSKVTFTYVPSSPSKPAEAYIEVLYLDTNNAPVKAKGSFHAVDGQSNRITPDQTGIPSGYTLTGTQEYAITFANGEPNTRSVTFTYAPPASSKPAEADIEVLYLDTNNAPVKAKGSFHAVDGQPNRITPDQTGIPNGYSLTGTQEYAITFANGEPNTRSVTFTYSPNTVSVPIEYLKDGQHLGDGSQNIQVGSSNVPVKADPKQFPAGYKLDGPDTVNVSVDANGVATPNKVTFNFVSAETPIPVGAPIDRWGVVSSTTVNFRSSPSATGNNLIKKLPQGTHIWMYEKLNGEDDNVWVRVKVDGQDGYIMEDYIDMMTQAQSDGYQATLPSPMPTRSPAPTAQPTSVPQYSGYALTTKQVALRTDANNNDQSILATLPQNTLVTVTNQVYQGTVAWSMVKTMDGIIGYVPDDSLRRINQEEAKFYIDQYNATHPTAAPATPTPSVAPVQQHGYAATLGDNVPMRGAADPNSALVNMLAKNTVVLVSGQEYLNGVAWHIVQYKDQWGYIRADQLRWLSQQETDAYLKSLNTPAPTPANTLPPLDQNSASSYGYVTSGSVNFRSAPGGSVIGTLNKYAFALVLGSTQSGGKTWYKVNQAGREGYISGDYFHVLSLAELEEFLQSPEYAQGSTGNTGDNNNNNNNNDNSEPPTSPEDLNVGTWNNPNTGLDATYEPFDPYATPEPIPTPTPSPTPEPLATFEPLPTEPPVETQSDSPSFVWLGLGVALLGGFGGLYAYALHKSNQRKAAARAAQRKAAMQQNPQNGARPYARATNAPMSPTATGAQVRPATPPTGAPRPQAPGSASSPYSQRPTGAQPSGMAQRPPVARPGQPGTTSSAMPGQQPGAFARPMSQPGSQSAASYRPEAQGNAAPNGQADITQHSSASAGTSRQPRAARHTGGPTDQNTPTDTNENL